MRVIRSFVIAFATYSRIPMPQVEWSEENRKYAMCFFPLIGAVVGGALWLWLLLCDRLARYGRGRIPELWDVVLRHHGAEAVCEALGQGRTVTVEHLLTDPASRGWRSEAVILMIRRGAKTIDRPGPEFELKTGDRLLVAGSVRGRVDVEVVLRNPNALSYVQTGQEGTGGALWRRMSQARRRRSAGR